MDSKTIVICLLLKALLILFSSDFTEMSFCKEFYKNMNEIDFGYQRIKDDNTFEYYLSIANIFWRIHFIEQKDSNSDKYLTFSDIDIDILFEVRYQTAFSVLFGTQSITGLLNVFLKTKIIRFDLTLLSSSHITSV